MTDPNSESEFEDEGSQEFGPVEDYLAVWDVGNDSISGKIVPNLPEVYSLITRFAEANATRHLPKEMCEAIEEHMIDGECMNYSAFICGCLAQLDGVDEDYEICDESSGTWYYYYYSSDNVDGTVNQLREVLLSAIAAALRLAYTNTTFCAQTPLGEIRLRIGMANSLLAQLLSQFAVDEWAFITSYNPGSQALPEDENTQRQIELKDRLQKDGFQIFSGEGKGDDSEWPPEPSFLVLGVNKNDAIAIGKDFGQNAIVAGGKDAIPILKWAAVAT